MTRLSLCGVLYLSGVVLTAANTGCASDAQPACSGTNCFADAAPTDATRDGALRDLRILDVAGPSDGSNSDRGSDAKTTDAGYVHQEITMTTLKQWRDAKQQMTLIDVREVSEYQAGYIEGAINLPWIAGTLKANLSQVPRAPQVIVYCQSGMRAHQAANFLVAQGYRPVYDAGGFPDWVAAGYPVKK